MFSIFDRLVAAQREGVVPRSSEEYLCLEIARRLGDLAGARAYLALASRFPHEQLITACHRARGVSTQAMPWNAFKAALALSSAGAIVRPAAPLVAVRVTRRAVAVAVFSGLRLDYNQVRELSSDGTEARAAVERFVGWVARQFPGATLACELGRRADLETRSSALQAKAIAVARDAGMSIWEVSARELIPTFSHTPCTRRARFREIVSGIWPELSIKFCNRAIFDAAGLGLFVQTWRLLDAGEAVAVPA